MTRSRLRPGYSVSSRSRVVSSVARSGYGNPLLPRSRASSEYYTPISKTSGYYDSPTFDYAMDDTMSRSNYISSAAIDDFYDTSARSRGKDRRLLDETTTAIVSSETHASPRAAVASLRARSRVPGARSSGPARSSSYQVKSTTLSSSSYPTVPQGRANYPAGQPQNTYGLRASKPPLPKPTDRKSIRDLDGFTKPKNMLSWQYRLESRVDPADIYHPGAFSRMRHQILDAQDKMDRHRQMLDRYLPAESGTSDSVEGSILRKMEELEKRDPLGASRGWN